MAETGDKMESDGQNEKKTLNKKVQQDMINKNLTEEDWGNREA